MSNTDTDTILRRTFDVALSESSDGRTLDGLCVPYNTPSTVSDGGPPYQEMFVKGAFARAVRAPNRVFLNFEHGPGLANIIGHGMAFAERDDGLHGSLRVDEGPDGEKALRLYRDDVLTSLSVEFLPMGKSPVVDGVVQRRSVHLDAVALCRVGAYDDAKVLAVRTAPVVDTEHQIRDFDPSLAETLARFLSLPAGLSMARAFTDAEWDGDPGRWETAVAFAQSCVVDDNNPGQPKIRALCFLPVREPVTGTVNVNAVRAALQGIGNVPTSEASKERARRVLEGMLAEFETQQTAAA